MPLFEIKHRFTGNVLFSLETESLKLCVEAAVKADADLAYANLANADLAYADLAYADLANADLANADLANANLANANLADANLANADLAGANLAYAYLAYADLAYADLADAKIRNGITVTKSPLQIYGLYWQVTIWDQHMQIGCEFHSHDEWRGFTDDDWLRMGGKEALYMKRSQFPMLIGLCDQHKPKVEETEAA